MRGRKGVGLGAVLAACVSLAMAANVAVATPGDLDRSFGSGGIVDLTPPDWKAAAPRDVAVGPADEIFLLYEKSSLCETDRSISCSRAYVSKLGSDGAPDPRFGALPRFVVEAQRADADRIEIDALGRPIVVMSGDRETAIGRLRPDGLADESFGGDGVVTLDAAMAASDTVVAPDGSIFLAATVHAAKSDLSHLALLGLRPDGSLDPRFGTNGTTGVNLSPQDAAGGLAFVEGELVLAATTVEGLTDWIPSFRLLRFSPSGRLMDARDPWPRGKREPHWFTDPDDILVTEEGGLYLVGDGRTRIGGEFAEKVSMLGLNVDSRLDRRFGTKGTAYVAAFRRGRVGATVSDPSGRLVLGGFVSGSDAYENDISRVAVTRRLRDGRLDRTFSGGNPVSITPERYDSASVSGVAVQSDGKILLFGSAYRSCVRVCPQNISIYRLARFEGGTSSVRCHGRRATIAGTRHSERIIGTPHRDVIATLGGHDRVNGRGGADLICGGRGRDRLLGRRGNDRLIGGAGNDQIYGGLGNDRLHGGAGSDLLAGGRGKRDRSVGGAGRDRRRP